MKEIEGFKGRYWEREGGEENGEKRREGGMEGEGGACV